MLYPCPSDSEEWKETLLEMIDTVNDTYLALSETGIHPRSNHHGGGDPCHALSASHPAY